VAKVAKAAGAAGGFLKKMLGDLIRPAKKRIGDAAHKVNLKVPGGKSVRNAHGVKVRDWRGRTIKTDDLRHPNANLLDQKALKNAANRPKAAREADAFRPGAPRTDPEVQSLTRGYTNKPGGDWPDPNAHPQGFGNGDLREPAVLRPGEQIDRFGHGFGRFTSPAGEPYAQRALPDSNLDAGYHRYEVVRDLPAWRGDIAPAMNQAGGGTQHYLPAPIVDLEHAGYVRRVYP
jgi:hypothetical protein